VREALAAALDKDDVGAPAAVFGEVIRRITGWPGHWELIFTWGFPG
jgi:hypothetical protein